MMDFYHSLDELGFSRANLEKRVKVYDNAADGGTLICRRNWKEDLDIVVGGSRGEGVGCGLESDIDVLFIQRSVKCFEHYTPLKEKKYPVTFKLDFDNVPDGYTMLCFKSMNIPDDSKKSPFFKRLSNALEKRNDHYYLGNKQILTSAIEYRKEDHFGGWIRQNLEFDEIAGPSRPFKFKVPYLNVYIDADFVQAFPCSYPSLLENWSGRKRKYDWPGRELAAKVKDLDVFVVPVGYKGSKEEGLQWRVSMTLAERALIRSFNDTQIKLYAAAKMLVKQELKPISREISSYVVKNIIFWVFEETPMCDIERKNFNHLFLEILKYLKNGIVRNNVQCYTIPSRNLLENKLTERQRTVIIKHIDMMIDGGIFSLLRCPLVLEHAAKPCESKQKYLWKELAHQIGISVFAVDPATAERLEILLFNAKSEMEIAFFFFTRMAPMIRETNPFGYFNLIREMSNEEILHFLLWGREAFRDYLS